MPGPRKNAVLIPPDNLKSVEDIQRYLRQFVDQLQKEFRLQRESNETRGAKTKSWRIKEAEAADVTAGKANAVGDLLIQRKVDGVWTSVQVYRGS